MKDMFNTPAYPGTPREENKPTGPKLRPVRSADPPHQDRTETQASTETVQRRVRAYTISQKTRDYLRGRFPGLEKNPAYWLFMGYLAFSTNWDRETKRLRIPARILAQIEGKTPQYLSKNYCGRDFLKAFSADVLPVSVQEWRWKDGKCRTVDTQALPEDLKQVFHAELLQPLKGERMVFLEDGQPVTPKSRKALREADQQKALSLQEGALNPVAHALLALLNNQHPHRYTSAVNQHLAKAIAMADGLENPVSRDLQLRVLKSISDQPQQFYMPSPKGNSDRVFPMNEGVLGVRTEIRRTFFPTGIELDLKACHLAICSRLWEVPEVEDHIDTFWEELSVHLGLGDRAKDETIRGKLKRAVYSMVYGKTRKNLRRDLDQLPAPDAGKRFLAHPLIKRMLKARGKQFAEIKRNAGASTCFGRQISMVAMIDKEMAKNAYRTQEHRVTYPQAERKAMRSILSQMAQAIELLLLAPVVELAQQNTDKHGFTILLSQHDGITLVPHSQEDADDWIRRLQEAVADQARVMGINTTLEKKWPR